MVLLMDVCKAELRGSVAQQKSTRQTVEIVRRPLVPSKKNNAAPPGIRKTREITSRYKCGITPTTPSLSTSAAPRRCPSPTTPRTTPAPGLSLPKRAQSADRKRPSTPLSKSSAPSSPASRPSTPSSHSRPSTPVRESAAETHISSRHLVGSQTADGLWPSMRSLTSSFNLESKCKSGKLVTGTDVISDSAMNAPPERKRTPLRGRNSSDQSENSKPVENSHSRTVDQHRWPGVIGAKLSASAMTRSMDLTDKATRASALPISLRGVSPPRRKPLSDGPGRVPQKSTSDRTRRMPLDGVGSVQLEIGSSTDISSDHSERSTSLTRSSRIQSLPIISGAQRPSSPRKASLTSVCTSRGITSPSRVRPSTPSSSLTSASGRSVISYSVISYVIDARKGKKNANIDDAHQLRLLYNRCLQWRFANARAEIALSIQKMMAENILYSTWVTTSELLDSVVMKKLNMQQLRQDMKVNFILNEQITYLEDWASLEREHSSLLSGAAEALKASIIRLPVAGRAKADIHAVKDAISSAVDVMQAMGSSVCYLLSRVEGTNSLISELASVVAKGRAMLDECKELLASIAAMQAQESSLRTHLLQLRQDMHKVATQA